MKFAFITSHVMKPIERKAVPIKIVITIGMLAAHSIFAEIQNLRVYRAAQKMKENEEALLAEIAASHARTLYLAGLLDDHNIQLSEFDLLALNNL